MTRIERIRLMEALLDGCLAVLKAEPCTEEDLAAIAPAVARLEAYYSSAQWRRDLAADAAGRLPKDLKRGVLSEDAVWNMLETWHERCRGDK